jgi:hypothetical protein
VEVVADGALDDPHAETDQLTSATTITRPGRLSKRRPVCLSSMAPIAAQRVRRNSSKPEKYGRWSSYMAR